VTCNIHQPEIALSGGFAVIGEWTYQPKGFYVVTPGIRINRILERASVSRYSNKRDYDNGGECALKTHGVHVSQAAPGTAYGA
jgi:hypothetical protein